MISPKLLDFSPFFFLIFSPLETADFFMLLEPPGDGYSLLCSKKQPPRHNLFFYMGLELDVLIWMEGNPFLWAFEGVDIRYGFPRIQVNTSRPI
jgi:hypothetical protein